MEPVSTLMLAASISLGAAATQRPKWEDTIAPATPPTTIVHPVEKRTIVRAIAPQTKKDVVASSPKERLFAQLLSYIPVGTEDPEVEPVSDLEHILVANQFLRELPGSIPLPTLMRNDDGRIGMFWDNDDTYIDLDVESNSTFSLYTRVRSTGERKLIENIDINTLSSAWYLDNFETVAARPVAA